MHGGHTVGGHYNGGHNVAAVRVTAMIIYRSTCKFRNVDYYKLQLQYFVSAFIKASYTSAVASELISHQPEA